MQDPQSITQEPANPGTAVGITTPDGVAFTSPTGETPLSPEGYRTAPDQNTTGWPAGVPYIIGNEACERFSFYGMKAILFVHLASLYVLAGEVTERANEKARGDMHLFIAGVYALPMIGAIIADRLLGKYRTILYLSLLYCVGHGVLAFVDSVVLPWQKLNLMYVGLALIAIGSGGIKPCVSANVGDQFGKANWFRVRTVYQIFYFSVNFGSFFSTIFIPRTREYFGPGVAFGIPGILMLLATIIFWMGRRTFVHVPPRPGGKLGLLDTCSSVLLFLSVGHLFFTASQPWWLLVPLSLGFLAGGLLLFSWRQRIQPDDSFLAIMFYTLRQFFSGTRSPASATTAGNGKPDDMAWLARSPFWAPAVARFGQGATEGPVAVLKIISVLFLISVFWALFDQHASSWIEQAKLMDLSLWGGAQVLANEVQAMNPLLVMLLIPLLNLVYLGCDRIRIPTPPLGRITVGMFFTALSFAGVALLQHQIDARGPGVLWFGWQIIPYVLLTIGEVMVSITALEFAYTQAPRRMKSTIISFYNLTVALGNVLVALLSYFSGLKLAPFFWVFAGLMAGAGVLFGLRALFYVQKDYPQE